MKSKPLGRTGLQVSEICLGTMTFGIQADERAAHAILDKAFAAGVYFIDTADAYPLGATPDLVGRTEAIIGTWLAARRNRGQIVLATKCFGATGPGPNDRGLGRRHILAAVDASLRRLQTDHIDLYQAHHFDAHTPIEETLAAFDQLVRDGKVRYVGVSNWPAYRIALGLGITRANGWAPIVCLQPRYNLLHRDIEEETLPLCREQGIGVIPYNPLAAGVLTGRYRPGQEIEPGTRFALPRAGQSYQRRYWHDPHLAAVERMREFFQPRGKPLAQVALAWVMAQPGIAAPILGASRPEQLDGTLPAAEMRLDQEEMDFLDGLWYELPRARP
jgi:aryl-alcohol dehydrogenase-like predicted oxidoreductase